MIKKIGRLTSRIIRIVLIINFCVILLVVSIQVTYRYNKEVKEIYRITDFIEKSYVPSIASGLFKIDKEQLELLLNGILKLPYFEYAELTETTGQNNFEIIKGQKTSKHGFEKTFMINYTLRDNSSVSLGELKLFAGYDSIINSLKAEMLVMLASSTIIFFLFSLVMLLIFQYLVSRHLVTLSKYAGSLNINSLSHNLVLNRKHKKHNDELDLVVSAINDLEVRLKQGFEEKEQTTKALIKSEARLSQIFNTVSDLIAFLRIDDNDLIIEMINDCFISTFNSAGAHVTIEDVLEKSFRYVATELVPFSKENVANFTSKALYCINTGNSVSYEAAHSFPAGNIYLQNNITPIANFDNRITHILFVGRNVTEQKITDKKVLNTIIKTEEKEKSRFAKEIHDGLGPIMSTAKLYVQSLKDEKDENSRKETLKRVFATLEEAITGIKEISNNLSPHILRNFGLTKAIQTFINKINQAQNLKIDFTTNLDERLDETIETTFYRVIIELINNTIKHANASEVHIEISYIKNRLEFLYTDNGKGFDIESAINSNKGFGLFNMQNRFATLNGNISFNSKINKGIKVQGFLPLSETG